MIGKLKGIIDYIAKDHLIIDVNGVGYIVFCSKSTISKFAELGKAISLMIETQVREDSINLYGFADEEERHWFKELITVKGVGSRVALSILGFLSISMLINAISIKDKSAFIQVNGVGPKLVDRIFTELKDKVSSYITSSPKTVKANNESANNMQEDAISALQNLGYYRAEVIVITEKTIKNDPKITLSDLIRTCLKELAK